MEKAARKKRKNLLINLSLILSPLFILVVAEIFLRCLDYGFDDSLFVVQEIQEGKPLYHFNKDLAKKHQFINEYSLMLHKKLGFQTRI